MKKNASYQIFGKRKCIEMGNTELLYEEYDDSRNTISNLKAEIIKLQGNLQNERTLKQTIETKYNRIVQELEHERIKNRISDEVLDSESENNIEDIEINYCEKQDMLKDITDLKSDVKELMKSKEYLERDNVELNEENNKYRKRIENFQKLESEMNLFLSDNKEKLKDFQRIEDKNKELEGLLEQTEYAKFVYLPGKLKEMEEKCMKLEAENNKLKKNNCNVVLLLQENKDLRLKTDRLENFINEIQKINENQFNNRSFTEDTISKEKRVKLLEKQIEISHCKMTSLSEKIKELTLENRIISSELENVKQKNDCQQILLKEKEERQETISNEICQYKKENETYRKLVFQFSEVSLMNADCAGLLATLSEMYEELDYHTAQVQEQLEKLHTLTDDIRSRIENCDDFTHRKLSSIIDGDDWVTRENLITKLTEDIDAYSKKLNDAQIKIDQLNEEIRQYKEEQSCDNITSQCIEENNEEIITEKDSDDLDFVNKYVINQEEREVSKLFKQLMDCYCVSVENILGYYVQMIGSDVMQVRSKLTNEILEFVVHRNNDNSDTDKSVDVQMVQSVATEQAKSRLNFEEVNNDNVVQFMARLTLNMPLYANMSDNSVQTD